MQRNINIDVKFSILVPVYNTEEYLTQCIESVINQSYKNWELILIDDGSTDKSGGICDFYAEQNQKIEVYHNINHGLIYSRRYAIEKASGEYYIFLDSDDYLTPDALQIIYNKAQKYKCDCIIYNINRVTDGKIVERYPEEKEALICNKRELYKKCFFDAGYNPMCRKAVKATVFQGIDYSHYFHIKYAEDLLQSIEIVKYSQTVLFIPEYLYNYRMNSASITQTIKYNNYSVDFTVREKVFEFLVNENVFSEKDFLEYRGKCAQLILSEIAKIAAFSTSIKNKKLLLKKIRESQYYKKYLSGKKYDKSGLGIKNIIYKLFIHHMDLSVLFIYEMGH